MWRTKKVAVVCAGMVLAAAATRVWAQYATEVIDYTQGSGLSASDASFNDASTTLGAPERFTGELTPFPGVVSVYGPAFGVDELVSLGDGGSLTVRFNEPIVDDAAHPFGVDLIVFGNAGFAIADFANLRTGTPATLFGGGLGKVEVSANGIDFFEIPNVLADQLFPTQGYLDGGPFDGTPGSVDSDFFKPVDPALTLNDISGKTYSEILALYDGSGGGLPIDIASAVDAFNQPANLSSASYVRVSQTGAGDTQIDAFVAVPEPATAWLVVPAGVGFLAPRGKRRGRGR